MCVQLADARNGDPVDVVGTLRGRRQRRGRVLGPLAGLRLRRPRPHAAEGRGRGRSLLPLPAGGYSVPGTSIIENDFDFLLIKSGFYITKCKINLHSMPLNERKAL